MKSTAPGSLLYYICLCDLFLFAFIFRSIKTKKYKNTLLQFILFGVRSINIYNSLTSVCHLRRRTPEVIDNLFNTLGCEDFLSVCRGCLRCVAWFSYWFDNLGFITEGNTYRRCAASSLPLWGNTDVTSSDTKRNFWRRCRGGSSS